MPFQSSLLDQPSAGKQVHRMPWRLLLTLLVPCLASSQIVFPDPHSQTAPPGTVLSCSAAGYPTTSQVPAQSLPTGVLDATTFWLLHNSDIQIQIATVPCGGYTPRACIAAVSANLFGEIVTFTFNWSDRTVKTYVDGQHVSAFPFDLRSGATIRQLGDGVMLLEVLGLYYLQVIPGTAETEAIVLDYMQQSQTGSGLCANQSAAAVSDIVFTPPSLLPVANCNGSCLAPQLCFLNETGQSQCYGTTAIPSKITASGFKHDRLEGGFSGILQLTNTLSQPIAGPIHVVFTNLPGAVTVLNATGVINGQPYITVPTVASPGSSLGPNQSAVFQVRFSAMAGAIHFQPLVYSGPLQ